MSEYGGQPPVPPGQEPGQQPAPPPYGQPTHPYGEQPPPYGQPAYGQPQYGQSPGYGQPQYGQSPGYGQPPTGPQPAGYQQAAGYPTAGYPGAGFNPSVPYGAPGMAAPLPFQAADLGQRFLARLIDWVILSVAYGVLYGVLTALLVSSSTTQIDPATGQFTNNGAAMGAFGLMLLFWLLVFPAIGILYEVMMIATRGATVGKMAMHIKVVKEIDGSVPGWGPSFVRWLFPTGLSLITCGLGGLLVYLSPTFDNSGRLQGWHDRAAKTLVVRA